MIDSSLVREEEGIRAVKYSFSILVATALCQIVIVMLSGSVALFADTVHNITDACTSVPLWIAFALARRKPSPRFTYGYGRFEDLAGLLIVFIIIGSALFIGYHSLQRLFNPAPMTNIPIVALAAILGFIGNETVARYKLRIGEKIGSAALVADGYHARIDSMTSLAVLASTIGASLGWQRTDPLIGLGIVLILVKIIYESSSLVLARLLDSIDPHIIITIKNAAEVTENVLNASNIRARWSGHSLHAELAITLFSAKSLADAHNVVHEVTENVKRAVPALKSLSVHIDPTATDTHNDCSFRNE